MNQRATPGPWAAALIVIAVPSILFLVGAGLIKWFGVHVPLAIGLAAVLVIGLAFLMLVFATIVPMFPSGAGGSSGDAFGLPSGSVRAILAIGSFVLFVIIVVYLFTSVIPHGSPESKTAATTIIGAVVTLISTVAAFYFGANSVKSGAEALAVITGQQQPPPEAITKGSEPNPENPSGLLDLVGNVNPRGQEVRSYFEYSDKAYDSAPASYSGGASEVRTVPPGQTAVQVRVPVKADQVGQGYWFRLVAVGTNGTAFGLGEQVKPPTKP
jgi:hypothetical protein